MPGLFRGLIAVGLIVPGYGSWGFPRGLPPVDDPGALSGLGCDGRWFGMGGGLGSSGLRGSGWPSGLGLLFGPGLGEKFGKSLGLMPGGASGPGAGF